MRMNQITFFLAQIDVKDSLVSDLHKTAGSRGGLTLLFGAIGIVTLLILGWAIFIRKRPDDGSRRYSYPSRKSRTSDSDKSRESTAESGTRKRRRRKRRPLNPTLAQTGGLPPIRSEDFFDDPT
jgi:hypothetical protein